MVQITEKVNRFEISCYTDGYPAWVTMKFDSRVALTMLRFEDLRDLRYAIDRMLAKAETQLEPRYTI